MRNKARVAGVVAAAAAGMLVMGAPAFAASPMGGHKDGIHHNHEYNGINILNENDVQIPIGICNNNVAVLGLAVPIASPQTTENCSTAVINQE